MDEIDEKLALYHNILELEDWLEIKHNPQILKEAWDTMNDYCCDLERMRHEIAYSELEDVNEQSSNEADEKRKQIEESYRELEALKESQIKEHQTMMELDSNSVDGYEDENGPRMVRTPWYDEEIPFVEAAEIGTEKVIRDHWNIECGLHWKLDVILDEDHSRNREGNSINNLAILRKIIFNLASLDNSFGKITLTKKLTRYKLNYKNN